ncbi:MAG: helix-turn-helix transcriptional regulator [Planctomycetes bacterium]|nr:helix-turn-helix transcriptional regulator [Planctomycetota bacterium]
MNAKKKDPSRKTAACRNLQACLDPALFKALGDPTRIHILACLARCRLPQTVGQVAACCSVDLSVVSRHLVLLRQAGVLSVRKEGRSVLYGVRYSEVARALRALAGALEACCPDV